jgi:hypothetical protein
MDRWADRPQGTNMRGCRHRHGPGHAPYKSDADRHATQPDRRRHVLLQLVGSSCLNCARMAASRVRRAKSPGGRDVRGALHQTELQRACEDTLGRRPNRQDDLHLRFLPADICSVCGGSSSITSRSSFIHRHCGCHHAASSRTKERPVGHDQTTVQVYCRTHLVPLGRTTFA